MTVAESGFPGFDVTSWYGIVVRAGAAREAFDALIRAESGKWGDIVRKANIQPQE